jgi:5-methylcytosine-specific restriction protein A
MNPNSAADYINTFRCMAEGKVFTRTINAYSMEYFLDHIYRDLGSGGLVNALNALRLHIEYYERIQKVVVHKMRDLYAKFSAVPIETPDEKEKT